MVMWCRRRWLLSMAARSMVWMIVGAPSLVECEKALVWFAELIQLGSRPLLFLERE
jgi:hypothetical protein